METKQYKLYLDITEPNASGNYLSIFGGSATGNIDSGAMTVSNKTGGIGNLNGFIHPETKGVFSVLKTLGVFISTDGHRMTFQNKLGGNALTFIRGFLEFVLQEKIVSIEGDVYEAVDFGKKGFLVGYTKQNGQEGRATMTNVTAKGVGKGVLDLVTAPVTDNITAFSKGGTTAEKIGAVTGDVITVGGLALSLLDAETTSAVAVEGGEAVDEGVTTALTNFEKDFTDADKDKLIKGIDDEISSLTKTRNKWEVRGWLKQKKGEDAFSKQINELNNVKKYLTKEEALPKMSEVVQTKLKKYLPERLTKSTKSTVKVATKVVKQAGKQIKDIVTNPKAIGGYVAGATAGLASKLHIKISL